MAREVSVLVSSSSSSSPKDSFVAGFDFLGFFFRGTEVSVGVWALYWGN